MSKVSRYGYIDALRGLAAMGVIYFHTAEYFLEKGAGPLETPIFTLLTQVFDLGKISVIVFFAISGFVVPFSLLKDRSAPIRHFVVNRFFRLYPAYWLSIPAGLLFFYVIPGNPITLKLLAANALMVQQFLGIDNIIGLYWTLQIELIFYVCCVALFVVGSLKKDKHVFAVAAGGLLLALVLAAGRYALHKKLPVALPLSLSVMFWGILWRKYLVEADRLAGRLAGAYLALYAVSIPAISLLAYNVDMGHQETWYRYTLSYYTAMVIMVVFTRYFRINGRFMAYLGTISYSVYLFGPVCQEIAYRALPNGVGHAVIALSMALSIGAAAVIYRVVEAPAVRLGHLLTGKK